MRLDINGNPHFWITFYLPISHFTAFPREMSEVTCKYYFIFICASQFVNPYLLQRRACAAIYVSSFVLQVYRCCVDEYLYTCTAVYFKPIRTVAAAARRQDPAGLGGVVPG